MRAPDWLRAEWDRVLGFACIGAGGLLVLVGYLGASDSIHTPEALSYLISGGIGGLFLLGAGAMLLVSADLHDEWRKLDRLEDAFRTGAIGSPPPPASVDDDTGVDLTETDTPNPESDGANGAAPTHKAAAGRWPGRSVRQLPQDNEVWR